jgi:hypothetical protein
VFSCYSLGYLAEKYYSSWRLYLNTVVTHKCIRVLFNAVMEIKSCSFSNYVQRTRLNFLPFSQIVGQSPDTHNGM